MSDIMKDMCVRQGYVPSSCTMPGQMCWLLVQKNGDPCNGCNEDRKKCYGRTYNPEPITEVINESKNLPG